MKAWDVRDAYQVAIKILEVGLCESLDFWVYIVRFKGRERKGYMNHLINIDAAWHASLTPINMICILNLMLSLLL